MPNDRPPIDWGDILAELATYTPTSTDDYISNSLITEERMTNSIIDPQECQAQNETTNNNKEITMKMPVSTIHRLFEPYGSRMQIKHKGKIKDIVRMHLSFNEEKNESGYEMVLNYQADRKYWMSLDAELEVDISLTRFSPRRLYNVYGTKYRIRCGDWAPGHYGTFINNSQFIDNIRGIRSFEEISGTVFIFDAEEDKLKQDKRNQVVSKFQDSPMMNMTCGFEFESQETNGVTWNSARDDGRFSSDDRIQEEIDERMERGPQGLPAWIRRGVDQPGCSSLFMEKAKLQLAEFVNWLQSIEVNTFEDAVEKGILTQFGVNCILNEYTDDVRNNFYDEDEDGEREPDLDGLHSEWRLSSDVEVAYDESVKGFEFRTRGPNTVGQFEEALESVMRLDHTVNTRCSFHIHVQVNGMKHFYNRAMRQHIINYLFKNAYRLPSTVLDRWKDEGANYFFLPDEGQGKMNFLNFHNSYKTLEFRCFGNINTVIEGMVCLELAVEAMQSYFRTSTPVFVDDDRWGEGARDAMQNSKLAEFVDAHQAHVEIMTNNNKIIEEIQPQLDRLSNQTFIFGA